MKRFGVSDGVRVELRIEEVSFTVNNARAIRREKPRDTPRIRASARVTTCAVCWNRAERRPASWTSFACVAREHVGSGYVLSKAGDYKLGTAGICVRIKSSEIDGTLSGESVRHLCRSK